MTMSAEEKQTEYTRHRGLSLPNISEAHTQSAAQPSIKPFAGRLGGVQDFVLDRNDAANADILARVPDAAPLMSLQEALDLRGFRQAEIWQAAVIEGVGTMALVFVTVWISTHPAGAGPMPTTAAGIYATSSFLGPLIGGITNAILVTLFIYSLSVISGAHLNPMITFATFCARITSLPRMVLYITFQLIGGCFAGLVVRAGYGSRHFDAGGCSIDTSLVSVGEAFAIEFMASLILLFLVFGVGLDPRQKQVFGPALAPALVGLVLGVMTFGTAFTKPGYGGASLNPARCFAVYIGSRFPGFHWIHWVGPGIASMVHGVFYYFIPPWSFRKD